MPRWYDNAERQIEKMLEDGQISDEEYVQEMRELNRELQDAADEEAERAREDYLGY